MDTGGFLEERQEASDPAVDCATIHFHTAFGKPLYHVRIAETIPDVPPDSEGYEVIRERTMREGAL